MYKYFKQISGFALAKISFGRNSTEFIILVHMLFDTTV